MFLHILSSRYMWAHSSDWLIIWLQTNASVRLYSKYIKVIKLLSHLLLLSVRSTAKVSTWGPGIHFLHCWSIHLGPWNPLLALLKYPLGALESTSCTAEVSPWDPGIHFLHCWSVHLGPWNPSLHETNSLKDDWSLPSRSKPVFNKRDLVQTNEQQRHLNE